HWVRSLVQSTTSAVEIEGLEHLDRGTSYLWLSNHRDIAMDPTLVNYALIASGWRTAQIAIGDNLLETSLLADLMRLNKSFIVRRKITDRREKLRELQRLSAYIHHALDDGHSVWLAQREGRAKDNLDHTDTAVLKMLALSGREQQLDFSQTMVRLRPVPVLVQYEWDPCDLLKARELVALETTGQYLKQPGEDTHSIIRGLKGPKGRVRICFGRPLSGASLEGAQVMASEADQQIASMKVLFPVNYAALRLLQQDFGLYRELRPSYPEGMELPLVELRGRYVGEPELVAVRLLKTYAAHLIATLRNTAAV
ncbi:MAG: 1-acyl-sn-glycerol-3-phosphate acyltransferase, partial [Thalassolituus sp.]